MGTFETDVQIPDLRKVPLRSSSVVLSSLRVPATGRNKAVNPLVGEQTELVPNVTHVFTQDQHLYLQFEVYDAAKSKSLPTAKPAAGAPSSELAIDQAAPKPQGETIRILTSVQFMQKDVKVYESKPIIATEVNVPQRKAVEFQLDLPLQTLKPGFYTCQVNIIDDVAGNYAFPRWAMLIKETAPAPAPATPSPTGTSR
jgi:hypothetical protein